MSEVLEHALRYAENYGWRVLPIRPGSKVPAIAEWPQRATTDRAQIEAWFGNGSNYGVGVATGQASGIFCLDVDTAKGKQGDETLAALERANTPLPRTVEQVTGSGGRHILLRMPEGIALRGSAGALGEGLDIRAEGGQFVAAPSVHPDTGQRYEWDLEHHPDDVPVADAPTWLIALLIAGGGLQGDREKPQPQIGPVVDLRFARDRFNHGEGAQDRAVALLMAHGWHTPERDAKGRIALRRPGNAPTDHRGITVGCYPGAAYLWTPVPPLKNAAHCYDYHELYEDLEHGGDKLAADRALVEMMGGAPTVIHPDELNPWLWECRQQVLAAASAPAEREPDSWDPVDLASVLAGDHDSPAPSVLWTRDGQHAFFYKGQVNGLHGDSSVGKSWMALLAVAQVLGAGRRAVIVDYEASAPETVARLRSMTVSEEAIKQGLTFFAPSDPTTELAVARVLSHVTEDTDLVVIDSLGEAFGVDGVDENSDAEVGPWLRAVARRIADAGPAVVLIDHGTKAKDTPLDPSGTKRKRASWGGAGYLVTSSRPPTRDTEGVVYLTVAKDRHGHYRRGQRVAFAEITPYPDGGVVISLHLDVKALSDKDPAGAAVEAAARAAVRAAQEAGEALSQNELTQRVTGQTIARRAGVDYAVRRGALEETAGPRGARMFRYVRPLEDDSE